LTLCFDHNQGKTTVIFHLVGFLYIIGLKTQLLQS
jgi:hypothetical protein